jgi:sugar lactone lactonase YvrE
MPALRHWTAFIAAGCLTACQASAPTTMPDPAVAATATPPTATNIVDLGAKQGATITVNLRMREAFATQGAPPTPSTYVYELRDAGTNAVVATVSGLSLTASFTNVAGGTYYARVDARNALNASIVVGGAQNSSNQVSVTGGSATYTTGFSLTTSLTFIDGTGGSVPVTVTNPYGGAVGELVNPTTGALLSSYTSGTPGFNLAQVADGTYGFWGFGLSGGVATPARQAVNVTVSGNGASVSGSWNLSIPGLITHVAGAAAVGALPANFYDAVADAVGHIYTTHDTGIGMIPATTNTHFGQAMRAGTWYRLTQSAASNTGDNGAVVAANAQGEFVTVNAAGDVIFSVLGSPFVRLIAGSPGTRYGLGLTAGNIYRVAGTGAVGFNGDGGLASSAELSTIRGVAVDPAGNLLINDSGNGRIRRVALATGTITTIVGGGIDGTADGTVGTDATFAAGSLNGLACDSAGNVFFGEPPRVIALAAGASVLGRPAAAGQIVTVAGSAAAGNSGDGGAATAAAFTAITDLAVTPTGDLLIADNTNRRVRLVAAAGGSRFGSGPLTIGNVYAHSGNGAAGTTGDAGPATAATLPGSRGIGVDAGGNALLTSASATHPLRRVWIGAGSVTGGLPYAAGTIDRVAGQYMTLTMGDGALPGNAVLQNPAGLAMDSAGNIAFADPALHRVRYVPAAAGTFFGQAMTAGRVYTIAGDGYSRWNGETVAGRLASLHTPRTVAFDSGGNLYIADSGAHVVRRLATNGVITTLAGSGVTGNTGDGGTATSATLSAPEGVAVIGGTVYIADTGNNRIRSVAGGTINALATGALSAPQGLTTDALGNLYIADSGNNRVQLRIFSPGTFHGQTMTAGNTYTAVTTPSSPTHVAVDGGRHVYYVDGSMVRMVALNGTAYSLVGGTGAPAGDGGPAASATIGGATGLALGTNGRVAIVGGSGANARVRVIQ